MRLHFLMILIRISLTSDVEHLFTYLLVICVSFWKKCLFKSSTEFLIELSVGFFFWILNYMSCSSILYINSLSVQFSCSVVSDSLQPNESQHARPPCSSPTPGVYPNPWRSSWWCHPAISASVVPFSSCPQSFPALGSFPMSQLFTWGGQSIGVSASTSVLPMNTQDWSPLGWTGWIFLQAKGLWRVFSNTTVQNHQFCAQLSS